MNKAIKLLRFYTPVFIKKRQIRLLMGLSAEAFGCESPAVNNLSYADALQKFAEFTKEQTEKALESKNPEAVQNTFYGKAYELGARLRKLFRLSATEDVLALTELLYKNVGIELKGNLSGEICIKSCYFSSFYSSAVCCFISALDQGMIAGLSDGGTLQFQQRITEGSSSCRAYFSLKEQQE